MESRERRFSRIFDDDDGDGDMGTDWNWRRMMLLARSNVRSVEKERK